MEPAGRERRRGSIFRDAAAYLSTTSSSPDPRAPISARRIGSAPSSSRPANRCGSSISSPIPASPAPRLGRIAESLKHGGGSLWTPLSLDAKAGIVYLPVGNPAPDFYGEIRPGANLYTNSLVALDAKTGKLLWYRQFIPHDVHDADLSQVSPLFTTTIDGKKHEVISVSGKDGLLRLLDRNSHDQIL